MTLKIDPIEAIEQHAATSDQSFAAMEASADPSPAPVGIGETLRKEVLLAALEAGNYNAAPSTLTQGSVLYMTSAGTDGMGLSEVLEAKLAPQTKAVVGEDWGTVFLSCVVAAESEQEALARGKAWLKPHLEKLASIKDIRGTLAPLSAIRLAQVDLRTRYAVFIFPAVQQDYREDLYLTCRAAGIPVVREGEVGETLP